MNEDKQKGFTLIELLVVIAIICILSSVVLASLDNARRNEAKTFDEIYLTCVRRATMASNLRIADCNDIIDRVHTHKIEEL